jgi:hypothetical protein
MKLIKVLLTTVGFLNFAIAQNTKSEKVEYTYIQLPMNPLSTSIKKLSISYFCGIRSGESKEAS